jgi:O-acetyl-ADP-ribose deacetylase
VQNNLRSISLPSISTGAFEYPLSLAAPIALKTIVEFLQKSTHNLDEVRMVLYPREDDRALPLFVMALEQLLTEKPD